MVELRRAQLPLHQLIRVRAASQHQKRIEVWEATRFFMYHNNYCKYIYIIIYIYVCICHIYIYYTYIDNIFIVELETRHQVFWKCPLGERVATRIPQQNEPRSVCKSKGFQMRFSKPFNYKPYQFFSGTKTPVSFFLGVFNEETN